MALTQKPPPMEPAGSTVHVRSWIEWVGLTCCAQQTHSCPRNLCSGPSPWLPGISTTSFLGLENVPLYLSWWNIELIPQIQWLKKYKMLVIPPSFAGMVRACHALDAASSESSPPFSGRGRGANAGEKQNLGGVHPEWWQQ